MTDSEEIPETSEKRCPKCGGTHIEITSGADSAYDSMIVAIYARKSTAQAGARDKSESVERQLEGLSSEL